MLRSIPLKKKKNAADSKKLRKSDGQLTIRMHSAYALYTHFISFNTVMLLKKKLKNGLGLDSEAGMLGVYLAEERRCAKN